MRRAVPAPQPLPQVRQSVLRLPQTRIELALLLPTIHEHLRVVVQAMPKVDELGRARRVLDAPQDVADALFDGQAQGQAGEGIGAGGLAVHEKVVDGRAAALNGKGRSSQRS